MITPGWNKKPAPGAITMGANFDQIGDMIGKIEGISRTMKSPNSVATMVKYTWSIAAKQFNDTMDAIALSTRGAKDYSHVYEWGLEGVAAGRLWRQRLTGNGGDRVATYNFIASVKAVPKPDMTDWTEDAKAEFEKYHLGENRYVFHNKAIVMESGAPVNIKSRHGGRIFIPLPNGSYGDLDGGKGYIWSEGAVNPNPGGEVAGNFTQAWETYWNTQGQTVFEEKVAPQLLEQIETIVMPSGASVAPSLVKMSTPRSFSISVDRGATQAEAELKVKLADRQSIARGYEEVLSSG